jgi:hypothetical protein
MIEQYPANAKDSSMTASDKRVEICCQQQQQQKKLQEE